jgi:hypothetical protein
VVIRDLAPLAGDEVYRLWALIGEKAVPCGKFRPDARGDVKSQFAIPVDAYTAPVRQLILTVEPASLPPAPVGRTVMASS